MICVFNMAMRDAFYSLLKPTWNINSMILSDGLNRGAWDQRVYGAPIVRSIRYSGICSRLMKYRVMNASEKERPCYMCLTLFHVKQSSVFFRIKQEYLYEKINACDSNEVHRNPLVCCLIGENREK